MRILRPFATTTAVITLALGGLAAPPAAAAEHNPVIIPLCDFLEDGATTVPAGPLEVWQGGWAVGTKGALVHWLKSQRTTMAVEYADGGLSVDNMTGAWSAPAKVPGEKLWFSEQPVVSLGLLEAGQSVTVTTTTVWKKPTLEFFFHAREGERPVLTKGASLTSTCVITAE